MKDQLQDLIAYTHGLGVVELVKVEGTSTETKIAAYAEDRTVIITGTFNQPVAGFDGVFGMPNLSKLKTILGFDDYNEKSKIEVKTEQKNGVDVPAAIHFETENQDFINDYRLMSQVVIEDKVKKVTFKGATWNVEFEPSNLAINKLKKQAAANSEELNFRTNTDGSDLKIYFGDPSTHSGNFVFQENVTGTLTKGWKWPVKVFLAIMDLPSDQKTVKFSDDGVAEITVTSGIATYTYLLPGLTK
jgi:hypothetical protein